MSNKSLPAYLQQVLEHHVASNTLTHDDELQGIFDRLSKLQTNVEGLKQKILLKRKAEQEKKSCKN